MIATHAPATKTILLVEQDPLVVTFIRTLLEKAGFAVLSATTAEQALRIEADFSGTIHLLLVALTMPATSGADLAQKLLQRRPELQVILMSSYPDGQMLAAKNGWRFLAKPFSATALLDGVKPQPGS
jgi:DNA-binding response OmpR family regulator